MLPRAGQVGGARSATGDGDEKPEQRGTHVGRKAERSERSSSELRRADATEAGQDEAVVDAVSNSSPLHHSCRFSCFQQ